MAGRVTEAEVGCKLEGSGAFHEGGGLRKYNALELSLVSPCKLCSSRTMDDEVVTSSLCPGTFHIKGDLEGKVKLNWTQA